MNQLTFVPNKMNIALDFDRTYTEDPEAWDKFIFLMRDFGHEVQVVTIRHEYWDADPRLDSLINDMIVPVYFTDGMAKKKYMELQGIKIDVWIDDRPQTITADSEWPHESLDLWNWRHMNYLRLEKDGYPEYVRDLSTYPYEIAS